MEMQMRKDRRLGEESEVKQVVIFRVVKLVARCLIEDSSCIVVRGERYGSVKPSCREQMYFVEALSRLSCGHFDVGISYYARFYASLRELCKVSRQNFISLFDIVNFVCIFTSSIERGFKVWRELIQYWVISII